MIIITTIIIIILSRCFSAAAGQDPPPSNELYLLALSRTKSWIYWKTNKVSAAVSEPPVEKRRSHWILCLSSGWDCSFRRRRGRPGVGRRGFKLMSRVNTRLIDELVHGYVRRMWRVRWRHGAQTSSAANEASRSAARCATAPPFIHSAWKNCFFHCKRRNTSPWCSAFQDVVRAHFLIPYAIALFLFFYFCWVKM